MSGPFVFQSFGGSLTFKSFFKMIPSGIKWFVGLNIVVYLLQKIVGLFFGFNLLSYLAFVPSLVVHEFFIHVFLTAPFVCFDIVNLISLLIFMIFFGLSYNHRYGDRQFINVIIIQSLVLSGLYFLTYLGADLILAANHPFLGRFNHIDLTNTLRTVLIILWGYDFWHYDLIPPFKIKHAVILFLSLDVIINLRHFQTGYISPWFTLMAIPVGYWIAKYNLAARLDIAGLFKGARGPKGPTGSSNSSRKLEKSHLRVVK